MPGRAIVVDNWALPGARVDELASVIADQPNLGSYDMAIVVEGVNDQHTTPVDVWRPKYEAAIEALEDRGPTVIVATPPPGFENGAFTTRYDPTADALRGMATGDRSLLDIAARWHADGPTVAAAYYADLIHQSAVGQDVVAQMARDLIVKLIDR
jgi:hypothetical protein